METKKPAVQAFLLFCVCIDLPFSEDISLASASMVDKRVFAYPHV